jgi:hypothetical protein
MKHDAVFDHSKLCKEYSACCCSVYCFYKVAAFKNAVLQDTNPVSKANTTDDPAKNGQD